MSPRRPMPDMSWLGRRWRRRTDRIPSGKARFDAVALLQQQHIDEGPRCHCGDPRRAHTGTGLDGHIKTPGLSGYDGPCRIVGCGCPTYRPVGIDYRILNAREINAERLLLEEGLPPERRRST